MKVASLDENFFFLALLVIHKSSRFESLERTGFEAALKKRGCLYDLVSLSPTSSARLLRAGQ